MQYMIFLYGLEPVLTEFHKYEYFNEYLEIRSKLKSKYLTENGWNLSDFYTNLNFAKKNFLNTKCNLSSTFTL